MFDYNRQETLKFLLFCFMPFPLPPVEEFEVTVLFASRFPTLVPLTYKLYVFPFSIFTFEIIIMLYDFFVLNDFTVFPELSFSTTSSPELPEVWKLKEYCVELLDGF